MLSKLLPSICIIGMLSAPSLAATTEIPGPIISQVVSVYDGDTLTVDAKPWPGTTIRTNVRVNGIDTPEIRGKCPREKALAIQARDKTRELVGLTIRLHNVHFGKFAGRVVADVQLLNGSYLSDALIAMGLARKYDGTGPRQSWCG